jgi:predicted PurR-regulated permease PerM
MTTARTEALPRGLLIVLGAAAVVITAAGIRAASDIIGPIFAAVVITVAVHPLRDWAARHGLPPWLGLLIGILGAYVLILGLGFLLVVSLGRFATLLPDYADDMDELVADATAWLEKLGIGEEQISDIAGAFEPSRLVDLVAGILGAGLSVTSALFFLLTLLLMMAIDAGSLPRALQLAGRSRPRAVAGLEKFAVGTRRYLVASTIFGLIVAVIDTFALWALGVPAPYLWGLLAFITNYIPNIGFVIGLVPPAALALLDGGVSLMLWVIVIYCVVNFVIQSVIQPKVVGDAVGLSPTITFVSLVFWAWLLGAVGALFAVPLTLLVKSLLVDVDDDWAWIRPLIGGGAAARSTEEESP